MKSKKCAKCGFVCGETADICKSCGACFNEAAASFASAFHSYPAPGINSAKYKKLAQISLAAAFAALIWSQLSERLGEFAILLTLVLLVPSVLLATIALVQGKRNELGNSGKRFAQAALVASGVVFLLFASAIPSLIPKKKAPAVVSTAYESKEGRFSVLMPGVAKHTMKFLDPDRRQAPLHFAEVDLGRMGEANMAFADFTGYSTAASDDTMLDDAAQRMEKSGEMTILSKKEISLYGYKGREVLLQPNSLKFGKDSFAIARIYLKKPRMYMHMIAGPKSGELDRDKFKYLDSLHLFSSPLIEAVENGRSLTPEMWSNSDQREREIAFVRAARKGYRETLRLLNNADVSINSKDDMGRTALMMAAAYSTPVYQESESCTKFLISRGANLDAQDNDRQWTALMWSIVEGQGNAAMKIISAGADVNIRDKSGATALTYARRLNDGNIIQALLNAGAKE